MFCLLAGVGVAVLCGFVSSVAGAGPLWRPLDVATEPVLRKAASHGPAPARFHAARLDRVALSELLARAPLEFDAAAPAPESNRGQSPISIIELPMPDGSLARFRFEESPIIERELAEKYPELKTYRAYGLDDRRASARFDWLPSGFHAMILGPSGTAFIDPHDADADHYIAYHKHDVPKSADGFACDVANDDDALHGFTKSASSEAAIDAIAGAVLRKYRLALAATNEYAVAAGNNSVAGTLAAQVLLMNRVNGVYERELGIRMVIVGNNDLIAYAGNNTRCGGACNADNDPYSNGNGIAMLAQNQSNLDLVIGSSNYDIGHVLGTAGGGVASLGVVCTTGGKARGVTGLRKPTGDVFAIDYVAHEMGHQWGASHTFNGTDGACSDNRSNNSAYEPGSAVTIMGYAGICGTQNLAAHSIDTFHVRSLEAIAAYSQSGNGSFCAVQTPTGNAPPSVSGPGNFTIPRRTPFALTANASDIDDDAITYDWQEADLDTGGAGTSATPNSDADGVARPIFRAYPPATAPTRTFPSLEFILNHANVPPATTNGYLTGEMLPSIARTMQFKVVVRDNQPNGGGVGTAASTIKVDGAAGPFAVTSPNAYVLVRPMASLDVTWDVAGTSAPPISASHVRISLSTDGGLTFPIVLAASMPNDGTASVTLPDVQTAAARIKVEAIGNVFFDVSDANFAIGTVAPTLDVDMSSPATKYSALSDGLLLIRYLFGLTGSTLTGNALGATAKRTDPAAIVAYLDEIRPSLDIDGDGSAGPLTDGLIALRYMFGLRGDALISGTLGSRAMRRTAAAVEAYLRTLMP